MNKYEKINIPEEIMNSHYDNEYDYLYLFSHVLTIIKISDWSRIFQISFAKHEVVPLNSSGTNNSLIKGFIFADKNIKNNLIKYSFYCSKLNNKDDHDKSLIKIGNICDLNKILFPKNDNQNYSYKSNIIDANEVFKKKYLNIGEIKTELENNFKLSLSLKKEKAKKELEDLNEKGTIYAQYIQLIKILIKDNVNKKILTKYLQFLKQNDEQLKKFDDVELFDEEIEYYSVCYSKDELMDNFGSTKEKSEKSKFLSLLDTISKQILDEKDIDSFLSKFKVIKQNLTTFNQPVEFENKELYFYISKVIISLEILREKKNNFEYLKNIQSSIKMVLDRKLFDDESIINDKNKFIKLILIILRGQTKDITNYNLNLLNERNYSKEEKEELISKIDNSLLLKNDIIPAHVINIQVDKINIILVICY